MNSCIKYAINEHEDFDQYSLYSMLSERMACCSCSASLVNQNEIPVDLFNELIWYNHVL